MSACDVLTRNISIGIVQGRRPDFMRFWILDLGLRIYFNPQSQIRIPQSSHGDAIVRESHPLTLSGWSIAEPAPQTRNYQNNGLNCHADRDPSQSMAACQ